MSPLQLPSQRRIRRSLRSRPRIENLAISTDRPCRRNKQIRIPLETVVYPPPIALRYNLGLLLPDWLSSITISTLITGCFPPFANTCFFKIAVVSGSCCLGAGIAFHLEEGIWIACLVGQDFIQRSEVAVYHLEGDCRSQKKDDLKRYPRVLGRNPKYIPRLSGRPVPQ